MGATVHKSATPKTDSRHTNFRQWARSAEQRRLRLELLAKSKQNTLRHVRRNVIRVSTNRLGRNHCGIGIILQQVSLSAIIYSSNMTLCSFNVICEFIINYM